MLNLPSLQMNREFARLNVAAWPVVVSYDPPIACNGELRTGQSLEVAISMERPHLKPSLPRASVLPGSEVQHRLLKDAFSVAQLGAPSMIWPGEKYASASSPWLAKGLQ